MRLFFFISACFLGISLISITFGSVHVSLMKILNGSLNSTEHLIVYSIRTPRIIMVAMSGACLSIIGVYMQTITKNQLAEPYILGIASGASTGAVSSIILGMFSFLGTYNVYGGAIIGSCIATGLVVFLVGNDDNPVKLILIGVGVSSFFSALTTLIIYTSTNEAQIRSAMFWMVGSFSGIHWNDLPPLIIATIFILVIGLFFSKELDLLLLGKQQAQLLGLPIKHFYLLITLSSSCVVAVLVAKTGVIGFIGLIVPHFCRKITGVKHKWLIPYSAILGSILLIIADDTARTLFKPEELPIGIMTSAIGAPLFIYIIMKTFKREKDDKCK